jgi:hypothetical protein
MTSALTSTVRRTREFLDVCDRLLAGGQSVRFRAEGWSMYPAIRDGEMVEITPADVAQIRRGDVLLCRLGAGSVAHRVLRIQRRGAAVIEIVLRGDAAFAADAPIGPGDVLGRVVAVTRGGRPYRLDGFGGRLIGSLTARAWRAKRWLAARLSTPG